MSDWLAETVNTFSEYESPKRFYYWSCLAAVSAIVKDQVFFKRGKLYDLFPNVFILLYGPSAVKKGPPIALARSIVSKVNNTRIINGRYSVEQIIQKLSQAQMAPGGIIHKDSCGFIVSSEMSSSLIGSTSFLDTMTDLSDRFLNDEEWTHGTKGGGDIVLKNPTITWLAGTNEALFKDFIPEKNLKGGLIGRTFVISEHKSEVINSLMFDPISIPDRDAIAKAILPLAKLKGPFNMDIKLREEFDDWYIKFTTQVIQKSDDDTGTLGRTSDNILKVAMLLALARRGELCIKRSDILEATKEVISLYSPTKKITSSSKVQAIDNVEKTLIVIRHLANQDQLSDTQVNILRKYTLKLDHEDLDRIVTQLERQQVLQVIREGKEILYVLKQDDERVREYVEQYRK